MDLSFYPLTLEAVDQAQAESLCLFVGEDERPLRGLAGLVDWRLAGGLSKFLRSGFVTGKSGDALLTMAGPRLGFEKLFIFGMGPLGQTEEELAVRLGEGLRRLGAAGVRGAAFDLPAGLSVEAGVRTLVDEREGPPRALVFGADPGALVTALAHAATRGGNTEAPVVERRVVKVPGPPSPPRLGPGAAIVPSQPAMKPVGPSAASQPSTKLVAPSAATQPVVKPAAPSLPSQPVVKPVAPPQPAASPLTPSQPSVRPVLPAAPTPGHPTSSPSGRPALPPSKTYVKPTPATPEPGGRGGKKKRR